MLLVFSMVRESGSVCAQVVLVWMRPSSSQLAGHLSAHLPRQLSIKSTSRTSTCWSRSATTRTVTMTPAAPPTAAPHPPTCDTLPPTSRPPQVQTHTHMECTVEYDGLRHRRVRRWAKSPIRDVASVARPNRAGDDDDLLLASCPFPVQLGNPRLLK